MLRSVYLPLLSGPLKHPMSVALFAPAGLVTCSPPTALLSRAALAALGGELCGPWGAGVFCGVGAEFCAKAGKLITIDKVRA